MGAGGSGKTSMKGMIFANLNGTVRAQHYELILLFSVKRESLKLGFKH